jgi:hypothetical protein
MRLKAYTIIADAVEKGAMFGWRRAFKYSDDPEDSEAVNTITNEIMGALSDVIDWGDEPQEDDL